MLPLEIAQRMYDNDTFSQWLGIEIADVGEGHAELYMTIRPEMTNGFGIAHGGITYSLADSALAFASNSHGRWAVSIETSISHTAPLYVGDVIMAQAMLETLSYKTGIYRVVVRRQTVKNTDTQKAYTDQKTFSNPITQIINTVTSELIPISSNTDVPLLGEVVAVFKGVVYRKDTLWE